MQGNALRIDNRNDKLAMVLRSMTTFFDLARGHFTFPALTGFTCLIALVSEPLDTQIKEPLKRTCSRQNLFDNPGIGILN
jgi:hypothetical protein